MELTDQQKMERHARKVEAFDKEYQELCQKHGMTHQPFLQYKPQGVIPVCLPVLIETENHEDKKQDRAAD